MIHEKDRQEGQRRSMQAERQELQQATRRFIRSLLRTGANVALLPVTSLPSEPQRHFLVAGREFTRGWTTLLHEFAHSIEEMAKDPNTPTHRGEDAHTRGEAEESQETYTIH